LAYLGAQQAKGYQSVVEKVKAEEVVKPAETNEPVVPN